jgi:hypothetical protein
MNDWRDQAAGHVVTLNTGYTARSKVQCEFKFAVPRWPVWQGRICGDVKNSGVDRSFGSGMPQGIIGEMIRFLHEPKANSKYRSHPDRLPIRKKRSP